MSAVAAALSAALLMLRLHVLTAAGAADGGGGGGGLPTTTTPMQQLQKKFLAFEDFSQRWLAGDDPPAVRKAHLQRAFREVEPVLTLLAAAPNLPPGLDPAGLAARIIFLRQTPRHGAMAIPLLEAGLERYYLDGAPLREHCSTDRASTRRGCQDLYSLRCFALEVLGGRSGDADACVQEYNDPRPKDRQFFSPTATHRQLPGLRANPWWELADVPFGSIKRIASHGAVIADEILAATSADGFDGWDHMAIDPMLAVNEQWDPRASWDAIPLYVHGDWNATNCKHFPWTCALLQEEAGELERLFDRARFDDLVAPALRDEQEYDEVPTLGVKLCTY